MHSVVSIAAALWPPLAHGVMRFARQSNRSGLRPDLFDRCWHFQNVGLRHRDSNLIYLKQMSGYQRFTPRASVEIPNYVYASAHNIWFLRPSRTKALCFCKWCKVVNIKQLVEMRWCKIMECRPLAFAIIYNTTIVISHVDFWYQRVKL